MPQCQECPKINTRPCPRWNSGDYGQDQAPAECVTEGKEFVKDGFRFVISDSFSDIPGCYRCAECQYQHLPANDMPCTDCLDSCDLLFRGMEPNWHDYFTPKPKEAANPSEQTTGKEAGQP